MLILKFGGGQGINIEALSKNAAELVKTGEKVVIVNGGNYLLDQKMRDAGYEPRIITSERGEKSRFTDKKTIEFLKEVYGEVAKKIETSTSSAEVISISIPKFDNPVVAKKHERMRIVENGKVKVIEGDLTGRIEKIKTEKIKEIIDQRKIPIIYPPAKTENDNEINIDGDKIASKIAVEMKADKLIFFANTSGLLKNLKDESSLIREISIAEADKFAIGRMKKKILAAKRAIEAGVGEVIFADGRLATNPIDAALAGGGTKVF